MINSKQDNYCFVHNFLNNFSILTLIFISPLARLFTPKLSLIILFILFLSTAFGATFLLTEIISFNFSAPVLPINTKSLLKIFLPLKSFFEKFDKFGWLFIGSIKLPTYFSSLLFFSL